MSKDVQDSTNPIEELRSEFRLRRPPFWMVAIFLVGIVASWIPLAFIARGRVTVTSEPRVHIVQDMASQPKFRAQDATPLFPDGRVYRPVIEGTVARGRLNASDQYYRGYSVGADSKSAFFSGFPNEVAVNETLLNRGQERFVIYCAPCHGVDGYGRGAVARRAEEVGTPLNVASLHTDLVRGRPEGHIFNTITNGIRTMGAYGDRIDVADRWAIVAYVRALELAQNPNGQPVPTAPASTTAKDPTLGASAPAAIEKPELKPTNTGAASTVPAGGAPATK